MRHNTDDEDDKLAMAMTQALAAACNAAVAECGPLPPRVIARALRGLADELERMGDRRSL